MLVHRSNQAKDTKADNTANKRKEARYRRVVRKSGHDAQDEGLPRSPMQVQPTAETKVEERSFHATLRLHDLHFPGHF